MATASTYVLSGKAGSFKGQQLNVWNAIRSLDRPFRVADIVPVLEADPTFSTTQTPERIAAYYVCVLKKSGHLAVTDGAPETLEQKRERADRLSAQLDALVAEIESEEVAKLEE